MWQIYNGTVKKNETMVTAGKWTGLDIREIRQPLQTRGRSREGNGTHSIKSRMVTDRVTKEKRPEWPGHSEG